MKQSVFMTVIIVVALVVSAIIYYAVFGNPANFKTPETTTPANIMGAIYLGALWLLRLQLRDSFLFQKQKAEVL